MAQMTVPVKPARRDATASHSQWRWGLGFGIAALVIFIFYTFLKPWLVPGVRSGIDSWLSLNTINDMLVWVIMALGLNIVVGYAGLLDLGFVAFWAIGGYTAGWLMSDFFGSAHVNILGNPWPGRANGIHFNVILVMIAAAAVCALFGVLIGAPTLRLRSDYLALVTLGFGEIIPQVFKNGDDVGGFNLSNGNLGIAGLDSVMGPTINARPAGGGGPQFGWGNLGAFDKPAKYLFFVALTALIIFISLRLREGRLGRAWLAIREDELAASAMGVPLMRTKLAAYAVGAIAGGLGGAAYAVDLGTVLPDKFAFSISIILLCMVVLGGMGNVWGVMIGALLVSWINISFLPELNRTVTDVSGKDLHLESHSFLIFGAVLVLMMLFRREGLVPETRTKLVLREPGRTEVESVGADMEQSELDVDVPPERPATTGGKV